MSRALRALRALDALERVLRDEIAALEAGDFAALVESGASKEARGRALEEELRAAPGAVGRDRLAALRGLVARNADGMDAAREAIARAVTEIREVREAMSIRGKYGPRGERNAPVRPGASGINKIF